MFAEVKDELALVLFGTDSTNNPLDKDGQYQNITVRRNLMVPDFELLIIFEGLLLTTTSSRQVPFFLS